MGFNSNKTVAIEWLLSQEDLNKLNLDKKDNLANELAKDGNNAARREHWFSSVTRNKDMYIINVSGALYTSDYKYLAAVIEAAEEDGLVKKIIFDINSPGGAVSGLFDLCETIKACSKPTYTYTSTYLCSAAFGIGVSTNKIYATKSARIGSVGVLVEYQDWSEYEKKLGIKTEVITSKNAENKVLDLSTKEGRASIQESLNRTEDFFIEHIANSRGVTTEKVLSDFGHGSVFFGEDALKKDMVDVLVNNFDECISQINDSTQNIGGEENIMSLKDLKEKDPKAYAEMMKEAIASASAETSIDTEAIKAQAQKEERERITAIDSFASLNAIDTIPELLAKAKSDGTSIEETKAKAFDAILANYKEPKAQVIEEKGSKAESNLNTLNALVTETAVVTPKVPDTNPAEQTLSSLDKEMLGMAKDVNNFESQEAK